MDLTSHARTRVDGAPPRLVRAQVSRGPRGKNDAGDDPSPEKLEANGRPPIGWAIGRGGPAGAADSSGFRRCALSARPQGAVWGAPASPAGVIRLLAPCLIASGTSAPDIAETANILACNASRLAAGRTADHGRSRIK